MNSMQEKIVNINKFHFQWSGCPRIVTRKEWGAVAATNSPLPTYPAPYVIVHHTAGAACSDQSSCSKQMKSIQLQHINTNRWNDIGYNFAIGGDGNVYEGREWAKSGAHAPNFNGKSLGVVFIGNFMNGSPSTAAINAFHALIKCGVQLKHVATTYKLIGHRQVRSTEYPGTKLYELVKKWPHYTSSV